MSRPPRLRAACNSCHSAKVKCSGQKPACGRCTDLNLYCKYEISMVGKVPGQRLRGKRKLREPTRDGTNQPTVPANTSFSEVVSPLSSTEDTIVLATSVLSPQPPNTGGTSLPQNLRGLSGTPSPFTSKEEEEYFDLLPGGDFDFTMQLQDVNLSLGDQSFGDVGAGVGDRPQEQWYTPARTNSNMGASHCEGFDSAETSARSSGWAPQNFTHQRPKHGNGTPEPNILTPADTLPSNEGRGASDTRRAFPGQRISDLRDSETATLFLKRHCNGMENETNQYEAADYVTACIDMVKILALNETAKLDSLDIILSDCKQYVERLGQIIREYDCDQSTACWNMTCTALGLVISRLEKCVSTERSVDVDMTTSRGPTASCSARAEFISEPPPKQRSRFRCPLPSISFGALQYHGREQVILYSNLMQTEVSRCLRLVRLLEQTQAKTSKYQESHVSAAKIKELWCKDFNARLQNLLELLGQM